MHVLSTRRKCIEFYGESDGTRVADSLFMLDDRIERTADIVPMDRVDLHLRIEDPEVGRALREHEPGDVRDRYALAALRIGILSLRVAGGQLDAGVVRDAGQKLIADLRELLSLRAAELSDHLRGTLTRYFDPADGALALRLEALLKRDGELDVLLRGHLGGDDSTLAKHLASHLGKDSPVFRLLSPNDAGGLKAQLTDVLVAALAEQRGVVLKEFSLDDKNSALSRLLGELQTAQGQMKADWKTQGATLVREFSLDDPNSALSRLVARVEATQRAISDQFSLDNQASALSRLSGLLKNASDAIGKNLTLDDEHSPLARLRKELIDTIETMVRNNHQFQTEVAATLAGLQARKDEASRSTRHGATFEASLGDVLVLEAQRQGDVHAAAGHNVGLIKNCKTGDHVLQLGPESSATGARIVWEAKEEKGFSLQDALSESETARKNRGAQIGVFVFSQRTSPQGLQPFARYGKDIVIVWDADDSATDLFVRAAYSVARALVVRERNDSSKSLASVRGIEQATRAVERQMQHLDQIKTWSETIKGHGEKIGERVSKMRVELLKEVENLDRELEGLRYCEKAEGAH